MKEGPSTRENVRKAKNADKNAKKAAAKKASKNAAAGKVNPAGNGDSCSECELQYRRHKLQPDRKPELQLYILVVFQCNKAADR